MQIKVKALGHRKKLLTSLSHPASINSLINFFRGLELLAELLQI